MNSIKAWQLKTKTHKAIEKIIKARTHNKSIAASGA